VTHAFADEVRFSGQPPSSVAPPVRVQAREDLAVDFELVKVLDRSTLLNPVQLRRPYRTRNGRPLECGIYVVVWQGNTRPRAYDGDARYFGPFRAWRDASAFVRDTVGARS
jgi:hypothetical protein